MSLLQESSIETGVVTPVRLPEYAGNSLRFEGINIQMDKGQWVFGEGENQHIIDTYSIWSPTHHEEIAERLAGGEIAASYMMGNYGFVEMRRPGERAVDPMFDILKRRPRENNLVAFVDPDDIIDVLDVDRLPEEFKSLRWAGQRHNLYPGPLHAILPIKKNAEVDSAIVKSKDNTMSAFWIPGHWGYEALGDKLRKKVKLGFLGGSSGNVQGEDPSYTTKEFYGAMLEHPEWQGVIKMILIDEIAEASRIGRSQSQVRFSTYPAEMVRVGSLSAGAIEMYLGKPVTFEPERMATDKNYTASSKTKYNAHNDQISDKKVSNVMEQIGRYKDYYGATLQGKKHRAPFTPRRISHPA